MKSGGRFSRKAAKASRASGVCSRSPKIRASSSIWAEIAAGSRLVVGSGGLGTTSAALAAGLPLAILPVDLEKRLTAEAVAALGAGCVLRAGQDGTAQALADQIVAAASDPAGLARAAARAATFRDRIGDPAPLVVRHVEALCGHAP